MREEEGVMRDEYIRERQKRKLLSKQKSTNSPLSASSPSPSQRPSLSSRPSLLSKGAPSGNIPPSSSSSSSSSPSSSTSSSPSPSSSSSSPSSSCRCECTKETLQNLTVPHILASTVGCPLLPITPLAPIPTQQTPGRPSPITRTTSPNNNPNPVLAIS